MSEKIKIVIGIVTITISLFVIYKNQKAQDAMTLRYAIAAAQAGK